MLCHFVHVQVDVKMHLLLQKLWKLCLQHQFRQGQVRVEGLLSGTVELSQSIQSTEERISSLRSEQLQQQADAAKKHEDRLQRLENDRAEVQLQRSDPDTLSESKHAELQQQHQEITESISDAQRVHELALQAARRAGERLLQKHQARLVEQQQQQAEQRIQLRLVASQLKPELLASCNEEQREEL